MLTSILTNPLSSSKPPHTAPFVIDKKPSVSNTEEGGIEVLRCFTFLGRLVLRFFTHWGGWCWGGNGMCWVRLGQVLRFEIRLGWSNWKWKDNAWIGSLASSFPFQHLRRLHHSAKEERPEIHYNLWTLDPGNLQFSNISRCTKIDGWVANSFFLN